MNFIKLRVMTIAIVTGIAAMQFDPAQAAPVQFPEVPLIVSVDATPNIFIQMDDSGSMDGEVLAPNHFTICRYNAMLDCNQVFSGSDGIFYHHTGLTGGNGRAVMNNFYYIWNVNDHNYSVNCDGRNDDAIEICMQRNGLTFNQMDWRIISPALNVLYFDPAVTYDPWPMNGQASFTAARTYPSPGSQSRNLNGFRYNMWIDDKGFAGNTPDKTDIEEGGNQIVDAWDSHVEVIVRTGAVTCSLISHNANSSGMSRSEEALSYNDSLCVQARGNKSDSELRQSVANWFQYYRRRTSVARAAVGRVLTDLSSFRYGMTMLNNRNFFMEMPAPDVTDFAAHNANIVNSFYNTPRVDGGTPLRNGLRIAGLYYNDELSSRPSPITLSCQKNFTILFTDGYWNGGPPGNIGDYDGDGGRKNDNSSDVTMLADVAKFYYDTDLSPLPDNVPTDSFDSNNQQHMVTYTIAFGVEGSLVDTDDDGWPDPIPSGPWYTSNATSDQRSIDDLWHAAWNSKGRFISAERPEELISGLREAVEDIGNRIGGAASGAANGGSISTGSRVFQAKFDAGDWHGKVLAFAVNSNGTLGSAQWDANEVLNGKSNNYFLPGGGRKIFTYDPTEGGSRKGTDFKWADLNSTQKGYLNDDPTTVVVDNDGKGEMRTNFIRGDATNEGSEFRTRVNKLGDVVNSDPLFVSFPPFFYSFDNYQAFFNSKKSRTGVVYFGANDGMLHAVRESDGEELFAYVPNEVIPKLNELTRPDYQHKFYVDGAPGYGDVQIGGNWRSVIAGSLRAGGQGVYALNVTNPDSFSSNQVLWEFTDENDPDLGYVFGQPQIKRMANGKWAVIVGSGLNNSEADGHASTTGKGHLFILFIEEGRNGWSVGDYVKIPVPGGSVSTPNGLFTPAAADIDGDAKVDYIYAGDLNGKLWKFDVTSSSPSSWNVAFSGNPLFTTGNNQPITARPVVRRHPLGLQDGALIMFGTGKYIEPQDNLAAGQPTQTVYAVWDRDASLTVNDGIYGINRGNLVSRSITTQTANVGGSSQTFRVLSNNPAVNTPIQWKNASGTVVNRGWYIDLPDAGERVVRNMVVRDELAFFVTLIPNANECSVGGSGWVMAVDTNTGTAPTFPVFDISGDQDVTNEGDSLNDANGDPTITPVGISSPNIPNLPAFIYDDRPGTSSSGGDAFPPDVNGQRSCGSEGARTYTFTTLSNGAIVAIETATSALSCGRQSWRQRR